jgi:hypothetical protein
MLIARARQDCIAELRRSTAEVWSLTEQAALFQRAGLSRDAVPLFEFSLAVEKKAGDQILNWLWLSLAYHRLGYVDLAKQNLEKATKQLDLWKTHFGSKLPVGYAAQGLDLHNWLEALLLRQEAEKLVNAK